MTENQSINTRLKFGVVGAVLAIIVLTVLELPAPLGFETRPQGNVSLGWLLLFFTIVITEIATIPLVFKKPKLGRIFGVTAGVLNILQVIADQLHLMQPEAASPGYTLLEFSVAAISLVLIFLSLKIRKT